MLADKRVFIKACQALREPVICEVGSRDALDGIDLLKTLNGKHLHVFEANPEAIPRCRASIDAAELAEAVTLNSLAVSDSVGTTTFFPIDQDCSSQKDIGFSSMFKLSTAYLKNRTTAVQKEITVNTTTLDTYFSDKEPPDVLWIDAEGAEMMVLRGASKTLYAVKALHIEVAFRAMHQGRPLFWEVDRFLNERGFSLYGFSDMGTIKSFLARHKLLPALPWRSDAVYLSRR